ncbi:MAG TPA: 50S ribosomal protein L18 [Methanomicrobia archaeon]|nr:50S ribosomal protein L18 [Methanomicrobia archaeon]
MGKGRSPTYRVPFRRRREGKTDYRRRLRLLLSRIPRVVVRPSNRYIRMQLITTEPVGDHTLISVSSSELHAFGYSGSLSSCCAAYLTGLVFGTRARRSGYEAGILDIGRQTPIHGSNVYAALKGAVDSGMIIPHDPAVFPAEERLTGVHIGAYKGDVTFSDHVRTVKSAICGVAVSEGDKDTE